MEGYKDRSLMHNSALACFVLTIFTKEYQTLTANTRHPSLEELLLVLPIVWHGPSRRGIARRNFDTPFHAVLSEEPRILDGLADRVSAHAAVSCQGLNIACEAGLLVKRSNEGEQQFAFERTHWPRGSSPTSIPREITGTVLRLSNWFKNSSTAELFSMLGLV
ncbi:three component ABC system middle component [Burkholderia sp. NFACC33-1]|uniref:three component ABC system middle component n=2 Tax=Burkholderiaceae TaxID=119060 RepID=UPI001C434D45|nr:three component ABC system middle component [Burkholderia sp. NFACC33-1]